MIQYLDHFINTKAKRFSLFYLGSVLLLFVFVSTLMMSGYFLVFVQNEYQLQTILTSDIFQANYVVRLAILLLKTSQLFCEKFFYASSIFSTISLFPVKIQGVYPQGHLLRPLIYRGRFRLSVTLVGEKEQKNGRIPR